MFYPFIFPAPKPAHYSIDSHGNNLFWIPAQNSNEQPIPCMFYKPTMSSNREIDYLMIFSHGNGCDLGSIHYLLEKFCTSLNIFIVAFEYPGYGLSPESSPTEKKINQYADRTYDFVCHTLKWPSQRILIYGHSIGTGVACYLASTRPVVAMILQSPYNSLSKLIREKVGAILSLISGSFDWNNLEAMKQITCPVLFIHGTDDNVIPSHHSDELHQACRHPEKRLVLLRNEDHNSFSIETLLRYVGPFVDQHRSKINSNVPTPKIDIAPDYRQLPAIVVHNVLQNSSNSLRRSSGAAFKATTWSYNQFFDK